MLEDTKILAGSAKIRGIWFLAEVTFHINFYEYFIATAKCFNFSLRNNKSRVRFGKVSTKLFIFVLTT